MEKSLTPTQHVIHHHHTVASAAHWQEIALSRRCWREPPFTSAGGARGLDQADYRMQLCCLQLEAFCLQWSFFTYSWQLELPYLQLELFAYNFSFFTYNWSFFAYSGKVHLIRALRNCKRRSLTVSKTTPTVSKRASPDYK